MFNLLKKRMKNEKGLTLVEVLAVVVILAIVAAIAIPAIGNIIENNRIKAIKADAINIISAAHIYYTDGANSNANDFNGATNRGKEYIDSWGSITSITSVTEKGEITATGKRGSVTIEFKGATIADINAESAKDHASTVEVNGVKGTWTPPATTSNP